MPVRHGQPGAVLEVLQVQTEAAVLLDVYQSFPDEVRVPGLSVRGKPHHLVFARIDLEAGVIGERRVQQSQGVRKMDFTYHFQVVPVPHGKRSRGPFSDAVHREHRRTWKWRRKKGARGMAQMMLRSEEHTSELQSPV